jgi:DNA polymerase
MKDQNYKLAMDTMVWPHFYNAFQEGCSRCSLSEHGCRPIVHRGNPKSDILLIGEAPGKVEQEQTKPFVGPAGELLDKIMGSIGLDTEHNMIIMNTVFCRPTATQHESKQNYTPKQTQIVRCWPFVEKAINILEPKIIVACGRTALAQLLDDATVRIGKHEGQWLEYTRFSRGNDNRNIPVFVMTHPAAILHTAKWPKEQAQMKRKVWEYMQYFRDTYKDKINERESKNS